MMSINFDRNEQHLIPLMNIFNQMCETQYPQILEWDHYDLYLKTTVASVTAQDWKMFRLNPKVKQWYDEEQELQLRKTVMKLIRESPDSRSTAQAQALTSAMNQLNKIDQQQSSTLIIYCAVPLTKYEEQNPNVKILSAIPDQIDNAIQVLGPGANRK